MKQSIDNYFRDLWDVLDDVPTPTSKELLESVFASLLLICVGFVLAVVVRLLYI